MKRISEQAGQTYDERVGATPRTQTDCPQEASTRLQMGKVVGSLPPHHQSQPHRTFPVYQNPRRTALLVSLIDEGAGTRKEEQQTGLAWLVIVDAGEKLTNLISNRLQSQPVLNLPFSKTPIRIDGV
jgi:hypothetical protein